MSRVFWGCVRCVRSEGIREFITHVTVCNSDPCLLFVLLPTELFWALFGYPFLDCIYRARIALESRSRSLERFAHIQEMYQ